MSDDDVNDDDMNDNDVNDDDDEIIVAMMEMDDDGAVIYWFQYFEVQPVILYA